jgi:hypothetical protein
METTFGILPANGVLFSGPDNTANENVISILNEFE